MGSRVALVTGVSRFLGSRVARRLAADPRFGRVLGVDTVPPGPQLDLAGVEFVRASLRHPVVATLMVSAGVDTVVHLNVVAAPRGAGTRSAMKEINVIGTMQLLAAAQATASVARLVVRSTTSVYGSSSRDPAIFTEELEARQLPRGGFARDAAEVESYVRGFLRRRPDVEVAVLRLAGLLGPTVDTTMTRYFQLPAPPVALGFDPRLQFLHETDAVAVIAEVAAGGPGGFYNVAGDGALLLSQALRRAGKLPLPVPRRLVPTAGNVLRRTARIDFSRDQLRLLIAGRVVDCSRLRRAYGAVPAYSTAAAFEDFVTSRVSPTYRPESVATAEATIGRALDPFAAAGRIAVGAASSLLRYGGCGGSVADTGGGSGDSDD